MSVNNEIKIKRSVLELNEILHKNSISADIRGQFVGTCLLALKSKNFVYKNLETGQIIAGIKGVIENLLTNDINKATKLVLLNDKVLKDQKVRNLKSEKFQIILSFIEEKIVPNINYNTSIGQDLLNLFFTTFNKYVGKKDKNQAFTPDHITHFMCKVADINRNTKVLDPTCGSGSFIVQALIQELNECETDDEKRIVKKNNIYGIEVEEKAFVVLPASDENVQKSARNLENVKTGSVNTINVYDLLRYQKLVLTVDAIKKLEEVYA